MGTGALILGDQFVNQDEKEDSKQPTWSRFELGTQNIGLIAGFAKACLIKQQDGLSTNRLEQIGEEVRQELSKISQLRILEWDGPHSPGILSLTSQEKQPEGQLPSNEHAISWKTFQLPNLQGQTGIRLSWSSSTFRSDIELLLTYFQKMT